MVTESRIEFLSPDAWGQWHTELLQSVVNRVYTRVPFYKNLLDKEGIDPSQITNVEMLKLLPFTTREDLANHYPYDFFAVPLRDIVRIHTFKSSQLSPIVIGYTKRDLEIRRFLAIRAFNVFGVRPEDIVQICLDPGMSMWSLELKEAAESLGALVIPPDPLRAKDRIKVMRDFKTTVLITTPSYGLYLLSIAREKGLGPRELSLRVGIFIGETLKDKDRKELEKGFGLRAFSIYGIMEAMGPVMAYECRDSKRLHLALDHVIPEVIDPKTLEPIFNGVGELVITTATTKANPLIRFRTGDLTKITYNVCECGRTTWRIDPIKGRSDQLVNVRGIKIDVGLIRRLLTEYCEGYEPKFLFVIRKKEFLEQIELWIAMDPQIFSASLPELHLWIRNLETKFKDYIGISCIVRPVEKRTIAPFLDRNKDIVYLDNNEINSLLL